MSLYCKNSSSKWSSYANQLIFEQQNAYIAYKCIPRLVGSSTKCLDSLPHLNLLILDSNFSPCYQRSPTDTSASATLLL